MVSSGIVIIIGSIVLLMGAIALKAQQHSQAITQVGLEQLTPAMWQELRDNKKASAWLTGIVVVTVLVIVAGSL